MKRLFRLIKGLFLRLIGKAEASNPELLLEAEKERLRENIANYNQSLAKNAGLISSLQDRDVTMDAEAEALRKKVKIALQQNNQEAAKRFALKLKQIETENEKLEADLAIAENQYKELVAARDKAIKVAKTKINQIESSLSEAKRNEALAEMTEMANGMVSEIGGSGDTLNRLQEKIDERKNTAKGRVRVAKGSVEADANPVEEDFEEDLALQEFMAAEGLKTVEARMVMADDTDVTPESTQIETLKA